MLIGRPLLIPPQLRAIAENSNVGVRCQLEEDKMKLRCVSDKIFEMFVIWPFLLLVAALFFLGQVTFLTIAFAATLYWPTTHFLVTCGLSLNDSATITIVIALLAAICFAVHDGYKAFIDYTAP
ncbi:MAG: hypothetical protein RLZZ342_171 [Candidatus Parcubacteria bacterium]|jgi:hypothetical protein